MIGADPACVAKLAPSLEDAARLKVFTQNQALEFIGNCVRRHATKKSKAEKMRSLTC